MTPPTQTRTAAEQARLQAALTDLIERRVNFNAVLGLKVESLGPGEVRVRFPMRQDLVGHFPTGRLHGGAISATLDALGGLALMVEMSTRHPGETADEVLNRFARVGTIDLRVDYLRPGHGAFFIAQAVVLRLGSRVGSVQSKLVDEHGKLVATGAAAYMIS